MLILFMGIGFGIAIENKDVMSESLRMAARDAATKPGVLVTSTIGTSVLYRDFDVFREEMTCVDITGLTAAAIDAIFNGPWQSPLDGAPMPVPPCHRLLRHVMILETRNFGAGNRILLRFPGVLFRNGVGAMVVRVPEPNGGNTDLHRIIKPPESAILATNGLIRMESNYWHKYSIWLLGGGRTTLPATYTAAMLPPAGFTVRDNGLGVYKAMRLRSLTVTREEVQ
jgi:hypothetical protein